MQIRLYPNKEIRCVFGAGYVPPRADEVRDKKGRSRPLDIPSQPSQAISRKNFKRHPLRQKARHRILHHGGLFRDEHKDRQVFLTGTLPGSTEGAMLALTHLAPHVVKSVQTYLPRRLGVSAKELRYIWVWELQKRGALHMHLIVECQSESVALGLLGEWRSVWVAALRAASEKAECDLFERWYGGTHKEDEGQWQIKSERVKKSVSRYLSKYESKGSKGESRFFPPRWYGISSALRADMREWQKESTLNRFGMISPHVGMRAARLVVGELLREFCVGGVTHKQGWGDIGGIDVFGYLREGVNLSSVMDFMGGMLECLQVIIPRKKRVIEMADFGKSCERLAKEAKKEMPEEVYDSYRALMTEELWLRFEDKEVAGINEFRQGYWQYMFLLCREGVSWGYQPEWASKLSAEWNKEREDFAEVLTDELI